MFKTLFMYEKHKNICNKNKDEIVFPCPHCSSEYNSRKRRNEHIKTKHLNHTSIQCESCKKFFSRTVNLRVHQKCSRWFEHNCTNNKCPDEGCGRFVSCDKYMKHRCQLQECGKQIVGCGKMLTHANESHSNLSCTKRPECKLCGKSFLSNKGYNEHKYKKICTKKKMKKLNIARKKQIIKYSEEWGELEASRQFGVTKSQVKEYVKKKNLLFEIKIEKIFLAQEILFPKTFSTHNRKLYSLLRIMRAKIGHLQNPQLCTKFQRLERST